MPSIALIIRNKLGMLLKKCLVYDQNQVSVLGSETKVQFWYRYWNRNFFFNFSHVCPPFLEVLKSLKSNTDLQK